MKTFNHVLLLAALGVVSVKTDNEKYLTLTAELVRKSEFVCNAVAKEPFFSPERVLGKPWRVYYMWNMKLEDTLCVDIYFKIATQQIIRRIHDDTFRHLSEQPAWETASLLMTMGRTRQEILLIPETETPGRFLAVPNGVDDLVPGGRIPVLKFQIKLYNSGKFLVLLDCQVGVASLAARAGELPYRMEIDAVATDLSVYLNEGHHSCTGESNANENVLDPVTDNSNKMRRIH